MRVSGANTAATADTRRRGGIASAQPASAAGRADRVAFMGVPEPELTPAVLGALQTLAGEIDELRNEVGRLVVNTTAKVTGKILTPDDQGRLAEETNRQLAAN